MRQKNIVTSFVQKGKKREASASVSLVRKELARVRATAMEGSFGTQKEHYGLKRINDRIKRTEILIIFFGIHTANVVQLARRIATAELCLALQLQDDHTCSHSHMCMFLNNIAAL